MKAIIEIPQILKEQQKIIDWGRKLRSKHISFSTIIEYLVSDKKPASSYIEDGLDEVRKIYNMYNNNYRKEILTALMIDNYRFENDIKEGDMVTNGSYVGYAFEVDYKTRDFALYASKEKEAYIDWFKIDEFKRVG